MTGLPYPTPTRLRLADAIAAGKVLHYYWRTPVTFDIVTDNQVTARVDELVRAGLATITPPATDTPGEPGSVSLTPDGMAWVTRARTREPLRFGDAFPAARAEGPVSTSPETGPPWCSACGVRHPLWLHESTKDGTE